jgi:hypothetical protein
MATFIVAALGDLDMLQGSRQPVYKAVKEKAVPT